MKLCDDLDKMQEASGSSICGGPKNCCNKRFDSADRECRECEQDAMNALREAHSNEGRIVHL